MLYEFIFERISFNISLIDGLKLILGDYLQLFNSRGNVSMIGYFDKIIFESSCLKENIYTTYYQVMSYLNDNINDRVCRIYPNLITGSNKYFEITLKKFNENICVFNKVYYIKGCYMVER